MINSGRGKECGIGNMMKDARRYLDTSPWKQVVTITRIIAKSYVVVIQAKSYMIIQSKTNVITNMR